MARKVFVTGCYDLLHSGHVEFFKEASSYGDLYVGIGSDKTIEVYKKHKPMCPERERLFMVKSIRYVKDAVINSGVGVIDFLPELDKIKPDVFVVNEDGSSEEKKRICLERGIEYVVLKRMPSDGLAPRSSTDIKKGLCRIPTRVDIAGTWIDQPYVSSIRPGWAVTISVEPDFEIRDYCGLSTSTRKAILKIWPMKLPDMDPEQLAHLVFCYENAPEGNRDFLSGAQDAIGICVPGLSRHYYDGHFWPERIETCNDEKVLGWLESHLCLIPISPRKPGCSVVAGKNLDPEAILSLTQASEECWDAILSMELDKFAQSFSASFKAQTVIFPGMINPVVAPATLPDNADSLSPVLEYWISQEGVLAEKFTGAGGGGYLALVVRGLEDFLAEHPEAIGLKIRRK